MKRRQVLRRYGGIAAAVVVAFIGLLPETAQIVAWLILTSLAVLFHALMYLDSHRSVRAVHRAFTEVGLTAHEAAELGADLTNAENHRAREGYRLVAVLTMLGIGIAAVFQISGFIAPGLFFIVALLMLNSLIDRLERKELKEALKQLDEGGTR